MRRDLACSFDAREERTPVGRGAADEELLKPFHLLDPLLLLAEPHTPLSEGQQGASAVPFDSMYERL